FAAVDNILRVLLDTKNIVVVVGTSPIEKFWKEAIRKELEPLSSRINFSWTDHLSFDDLLKQAAALPPQSAIFWELMIVDAAGLYTRVARRWQGYMRPLTPRFFPMTNPSLVAKL